MRVRIRRLNRNEDGAVLIVVALSMIALIGFSALVVDVGGLLVTRRVMVRASDSGALAAAQSCGTSTRADADEKADHYASRNQASYDTDSVTGGIIDAETEDCGTAAEGFVTVRYQVGQQTYFTSVLGLPTSFDVSATARAIWGPAGSGNLPPLMVSGSAFQGDCDIPNAEEGAECNFWYSKDDLGSSTWGWLSLFTEDNPGPGGKVGWNVAPTATCPNSGADERNSWLDNPTPVPALNFPDPTFVCVDTGMVDANWSKLESKLPLELQFPVNDPDSQVDKDGNHTTEKPDKYNVVGFVTLLVTDLYDGDDPEVLGTPPTSGTNAQITDCPVQPDPINFTSAQPSYDLTDDIASCEALVGESVLPLDNPPPQPGGSTVSEGETKWTYDSATHVITWTHNFQGQNGKGIQVTLKYIEPGTPGSPGSPGVCGEQFDGKQQDKCLVAKWVGFTTDGGEPGGGADFGNRPVRLCASPDEKCS